VRGFSRRCALGGRLYDALLKPPGTINESVTDIDHTPIEKRRGMHIHFVNFSLFRTH